MKEDKQHGVSSVGMERWIMLPGRLVSPTISQNNLDLKCLGEEKSLLGLQHESQRQGRMSNGRVLH